MHPLKHWPIADSVNDIKNLEYPAVKTTARIIYKIHACTVPDQTAPKISQIQAYTEATQTQTGMVNIEQPNPDLYHSPWQTHRKPRNFWEIKTISLSNPVIIYD